jgi:endonuclease YncB( thermonuclease family)
MRLNAGRLFLATLLFALPKYALSAEPGAVSTEPSAESIIGVVVRVIDGDTIHVLPKDNTLVKVRLNGIDAPELGQPYGSKSRQALVGKILGKTVRVEPTGTDTYGRTLGVVSFNGSNTNLELVSDGWAWHLKKDSKDAALAKAETEARAKRAGLWADVNPQSPWDWRAAEEQRRKESGPTRPTADASVSSRLQSGAPKPFVSKASQNDEKADDKSVVYIVKYGKHYHSLGCPHLNETSTAIPFADVKSRHLTACPKCGGQPSHIEEHSPDSTLGGMASSGSATFTGPRGGRYHYSASGKKVYERKK